MGDEARPGASTASGKASVTACLAALLILAAAGAVARAFQQNSLRRTPPIPRLRRVRRPRRYLDTIAGDSSLTPCEGMPMIALPRPALRRTS